ncbi:MAG: RNA polymerase sigma factor, partial [Acidimicrobiales bacterium]
ALAAYPTLRADSNVRGWLVTIAHHKAVDRVRATARSPLPLDRLPERPVTGPEPPDPDRRLWAAVTALPPKQRRAVAYHYGADLPYAEVAGLIGGSEAAARRAAADGIASLRATLDKEEPT